jgi:hypothetical protein
MKITMDATKTDQIEIERATFTTWKQVERFVEQLRAAAEIVWPAKPPEKTDEAAG